MIIQASEGVEADSFYEVWQHGEPCASASTYSEVMHYAVQYAQDGPVEIYQVVRIKVGEIGGEQK